MIKTCDTVIDNLHYLSMENEYVRVEFVPEIGGKMIKIINKETGRQFLLEPQNADKKYHKAYYGANFEDYDTSGFDECFPTIAACDYPHQGHTNPIFFPDHGELWSVPWDFQLINNELLMVCNGNKLPYHFAKRIQISKKELKIHYYLENYSDRDFNYLWSAHPLLQVDPGDCIYIRDTVDKVFLNWASDDQIGQHGDIVEWPCITVDGMLSDFSVIKGRSYGKALKCFTDRVSSGEAAVYYTMTDESLIYSFDPKENPFIGIWLCYGGWPTDQKNKHLTIALEPSSGRPDSLNQAIERNESGLIASNSKKEWDLNIQLKSGHPGWVKSN